MDLIFILHKSILWQVHIFNNNLQYN